MGFKAANILPAFLVPMLQRIEPSRDQTCSHYPCRLRLRDGTIIERALLIEYAHGLEPNGSIRFADIELIEESPWRMPATFANRLYQAGESGMGYVVYTMQLRDGRVAASLSGWLVDFPGLPEGVKGADIVAVTAHAGRDLHGTSAFCKEPPTVQVDFVFPR